MFVEKTGDWNFQQIAVASSAHVLSSKNCENAIFAGISDLTDIAAEEKQKIVILRPLDKIWPASRQDIGFFDL